MRQSLFLLSFHYQLGACYQLALRTPGIKPWSASLRKQIRQMPNFRYTARGRPHIWHRRRSRVENLGASLAFAIFDLLATTNPHQRLTVISFFEQEETEIAESGGQHSSLFPLLSPVQSASYFFLVGFGSSV
jgi:hypothetical protein